MFLIPNKKVTYINVNYDDLPTIDQFVKFIANARLIHQKYIPQTLHKYNSEVLTMLYVNYIEEYYEFIEELDTICGIVNRGKIPNTDDLKNLKYELIDMINYLGSIFTMYDLKQDSIDSEEDYLLKCREFYTILFNNDMTNMFIRELYVSFDISGLSSWIDVKNKITKKGRKFRNFLVDFMSVLLSTEDVNNDTILDLAGIRRLYPERKWHKPQSPLSIESELDTILPRLREDMLTYIGRYMTILMWIEFYSLIDTNTCKNMDIDLKSLYHLALNDMMSKQNVTLNLDKK